MISPKSCSDCNHVILRLQELPLADPKEDEVEVKYMASPVNPADINILQGVCMCACTCHVLL